MPATSKLLKWRFQRETGAKGRTHHESAGKKPHGRVGMILCGSLFTCACFHHHEVFSVCRGREKTSSYRDLVLDYRSNFDVLTLLYICVIISEELRHWFIKYYETFCIFIMYFVCVFCNSTLYWLLM